MAVSVYAAVSGHFKENIIDPYFLMNVSIQGHMKQAMRGIPARQGSWYSTLKALQEVACIQNYYKDSTLL